MEHEKKEIELDINNLIALCHILDNYQEFIGNLDKFIKVGYNRDIIYALCLISNGKKVNGKRKTKRFYQENKNVIDTINRYSNISDFINSNYDFKGNLKENSGLDFFYKYLKQHSDELVKIIFLLNKIKDLGFKELFFTEDSDFTNNEYRLNTTFWKNNNLSYLDNIEVFPNYQNDIISYKTTSSNYEIVVRIASNYKIEDYGKIIKVNSLLFDYQRLPQEISKETMFDEIMRLKSIQQNDCESIRNSVDLGVSIDDLCSQFDITNKVLNKLNGVVDNKELHEVLLEIRKCLEQLQAISSQYDDSILNDTTITKEKLEEEKKLYLRRRYWSRIDID